MSKTKVMTDKGFTNTNLDMDSDDTCESFVHTTPSSCSCQVQGLCLVSSSSVPLHSEKAFLCPQKKPKRFVAILWSRILLVRIHNLKINSEKQMFNTCSFQRECHCRTGRQLLLCVHYSDNRYTTHTIELQSCYLLQRISRVDTSIMHKQNCRSQFAWTKTVGRNEDDLKRGVLV